MKPQNQYGKKIYLLYSFIVFFIVCFWCRGCFLREIWFFNMEETADICYMLFLVSFLIHILVTTEKRRNVKSLLNVLIPWEIIMVLCYFEDIKYFIIASALIFLLLSTFFTIIVLANKINYENKKVRKKIVYNRIKRSLTLSKFSFIGSFFIILMVAFFINYISPSIEIREFEKYKSSEEFQMLTMENQYEKLSPLQDEKEWSKLDIMSRQEILEIILKMEVEYLGLPHTVNLVVEQNENAKRRGDYGDKNHTVTLYNIDKMTGEEALNSICHEVFHAVEHRLVDIYIFELPDKYKDLYFFQHTRAYLYEFQNYESGDSMESSILYYAQFCERDARDYAEERSSYIMTEIYRWVNGYEKGAN